MPTAYEGKEPYIFVSYSHKDKKDVLRYIESLEKRGFLVWFDGGIEVGTEWPEYIANRLAGSSCVIFFLSENFANSKNCRRELALTQELEKEQLNVYLEKVELPMGMRMQLGLNQAIWRENFTDEEKFIDELSKAKLLAPCRSEKKVAKPKNVPAESDKVVKEPVAAEPEVSNKSTDSGEPENLPDADDELLRSTKAVGWIGSFLEIAYIPISLYLMMLLPKIGITGFWLFLTMIIPHSALALINKVLFSRISDKYRTANVNKKPLENSGTAVIMCLLLATAISMVGGAFSLAIDIHFVLRLLISIGLNIVPGVIAMVITAYLSE